MAKLRFGNLNAEVEGDVKEIASLLRELNVITHSSEMPITRPAETINPVEHVISDDELIQKLPSRSELVEMIEGMGKPFHFILAEQQKKIFGGIVNTRENQRAYSRFYDLHKYARDVIQKKYGGHWVAYNEMLDGHQTTGYKLAEDKEIPILETEDDGAKSQENVESKNASSLLNF